jgi:hypothetical protein
MKHLEQTLVTYVYSHCNIYNIPIYFCNISMAHLQHTSETSETFEIYACNMRFQQNLVDGRTEHCTSSIRLCDHGREGGWQRIGGCAALGEWHP